MYNGFHNFMFEYKSRERGYCIHQPCTEPVEWQLLEIVGDDIFGEFHNLCNTHGFDLFDATMCWDGQKHWDLWTEDWQYLCKNEDNDHWDADGWFCYPADMLYWHKDGFYCEDCFDWVFDVRHFRRGRSLEEELRLAKQRGKCYRTLPIPVIFK